jgi:hypothetical protein
MERLRGIKKTGGDAGAVEGRRDFLSDVGRFTYAAKNEFAAGGDRTLDGAGGSDKFSVQAPGSGGEGLCFYTEAAAGAGKGRFRGDGHL